MQSLEPLAGDKEREREREMENMCLHHFSHRGTPKTKPLCGIIGFTGLPHYHATLSELQWFDVENGHGLNDLNLPSADSASIRCYRKKTGASKSSKDKSWGEAEKWRWDTKWTPWFQVMFNPDITWLFDAIFSQLTWGLGWWTDHGKTTGSGALILGKNTQFTQRTNEDMISRVRDTMGLEDRIPQQGFLGKWKSLVSPTLSSSICYGMCSS